MEHLHHFGLRQDPYQNEPDLRFYFDGMSHIEAHRRIERGLRQQKGLCVLSGEAGTGKSLLTRRLLEGLEEEIFDAQLMLMMPGAADADSVLGRYARMVGVDEAVSDRPSLLAQIYDQLAIVREEGRHSVLMLDDAHLLSKGALAEIGGLLNLEYEDRRLVSLLLVGLPQLDVTLSHEASLGQRIDVRTRLDPLDFNNTCDYLKHRLECAGGDPATIPDEALAALFKFGRGRPRLLNTVADNALFEAYLAGRTQLIPHDVERAAAELGIGSEPGNTYSEITPAAPGSGSQMPGAPGTTMELNDVAEPEFETSSFDTGASEPLGGMEPLLAPEPPDVAASLDIEPPEVAASLEVEPPELVASPAAEPEFAEPQLEMGSMSDFDVPCDLDAVSDTELTSLLPAAEVPTVAPAQGQVDELDNAVEEMMNASTGGDEPSPFDFSGAGEPEATRVAFDDEDLCVGDHAEGDELDDLFVELIEE